MLLYIFNWLENIKGRLLCDTGKVPKIKISVSINEALSEHSHSHPRTYCVACAKMAVTTELSIGDRWSAKLKVFSRWSFVDNVRLAYIMTLPQVFLSRVVT